MPSLRDSYSVPLVSPRSRVGLDRDRPTGAHAAETGDNLLSQRRWWLSALGNQVRINTSPRQRAADLSPAPRAGDVGLAFPGLKAGGYCLSACYARVSGITPSWDIRRPTGCRIQPKKIRSVAVHRVTTAASGGTAHNARQETRPARPERHHLTSIAAMIRVATTATTLAVAATWKS